jgi:hypothetical protein
MSNDLMLCCFAGCQEEGPSDLEDWRFFEVTECEEGITIENYPFCRYHGDLTEAREDEKIHRTVYTGFLCPKHYKHFRDLAPPRYYPPLLGSARNYIEAVAKADPELFDCARMQDGYGNYPPRAVKIG